MTIEERLQHYLNQEPQIHKSAYIASGAVVIGAVSIGENASIWHNTVLRADINTIEVGEGSNIQDGTIVHLADDLGVSIGRYVTIGHAAMIHACEIQDECLIGMQATILDGALIGQQSIIGAGALVTKGTIVPPGSLVLGAPAKVVRNLEEEERNDIRTWADKYVAVAKGHQSRFNAQ